MSKNSDPTWHIQALERKINFIVLLYEKAEGFVFCPTNLDYPFRVGGDYDGCLPTTATHAFSYLKIGFNSYFQARVKWFVPFLEKIVQGENFSLDDLELDNHSVHFACC
ncbi:MAG: hypothetical protein GVY17_02630 [Cyanobacteria bacterium]|jgi:hypothetical protein|nr:hypothetical protein [Cyanobacteria bacterium GSL.Bin21]